MKNTAEIIMTGVNGAVDIAVGVLADLTDYLEPRETYMEGFGSKAAEFRDLGWREVEIGPRSGFVAAEGDEFEMLIRRIREDHNRSFVFRTRQRAHNLLERIRT